MQACCSNIFYVSLDRNCRSGEILHKIPMLNINCRHEVSLKELKILVILEVKEKNINMSC